jgi:hypothetical protein
MTPMIRRLLGSSRYFIVVAVVSSFVASACVLVYGGLATFVIVFGTFRTVDFSSTGAIAVMERTHAAARERDNEDRSMVDQ